MLFKTAHHDGRGTHPAVREHGPFLALILSRIFLPICGNVAAGGAAGILLSGHRSCSAQRADSSESTPGIVGFVPDDRQRVSATARAAAALSGLVAAAARGIHGGAVIRSSVPQQLSPHSELLSVLGRLVGKFHVRLLMVVLPPSCTHQSGAAAICVG